MKKFIQRVQDLTQKAAHLKQVVEAAPAQAAQLRDTVLMTAGQLQQMRHDVQSSVTGLRADNDDRLAQALREINDGAATFLEAGYELTGVDMELSPVQRLMVHLEQRDSVSEAVLRSVLSANSGRPTIQALLNALARAEAISERVNLSHLTYRGLIVHVGPAPTVRLSWRSESAGELVVPVPPALPTSAPAAPPPPLSAFTQSSYFAERPPITTPSPEAGTVPAEAPALSAPTVLPSSGTARETRPGGDWRSSALDRFKKMPDVSKYRR